MKLKKVRKAFSDDLDKARVPGETVAIVKERLEQVGEKILTRTLRIDTGRLDIPVYISICGKDAIRIIGTQKQMGKGSSPEQAEASALMELVERYSFFSFYKRADFKVEKYPGPEKGAIEITSMLLSIHDNETDLMLAEKSLRKIPLRWTKAYNFSRGCYQFVPIDWFYIINEYNGPAAGNTVEEAILQGLCEVVERHVGSVVTHERISTPTINPDSVTYPTAVELLKKYFSKGISVTLKDFSLDTGIPTVAAVAIDPATFPEKSEIVFTAGTTPDPNKSLCRALTEVAQLAGDFEKSTTYVPTLPKFRSLSDIEYLKSSEKVVNIDDLPDLASEYFDEEIYACVKSLKKIDLEVIAVDVTSPVLLIPAVYCIIPGAHFRDRTRNTRFPFHLAKVITQSMAPVDAEAYLKILDEIFPRRFDIRFFMGFCKEELGNPEAALRYYKQSLELNPDPSEVASIYVHIGSCHKDTGNYHDALGALERAQELNPGLKEIYNLKGFCYFKLKEYYKAIEQFEKAIEIDPGSGIDYANIASNLRELGHYEEAIHLYKMALELDPDIDFARDNIKKLEARLEKVT